MEFTFWESKAVKLPLGPIVATVVAPVIGLTAITILSTFFGTTAPRKGTEFSGLTLKELQAIETVVASGDPAKIGEMIKKDGAQVGADVEKWVLVSQWKNRTLFDLYQADLLVNVRGQIDGLKKAQQAAEEAAKREAGGAAGGPAAPAKQP